MRAATIDPILIPRERVHERLDEEPKRMAFVQFELLEQFAQRLGFATAARQVLQVVTDLVAQKPLHRRKIDKIAHGTDLSVDFEQIPNGSAIRVTAGQRGKIFETQAPF